MLQNLQENPSMLESLFYKRDWQRFFKKNTDKDAFLQFLRNQSIYFGE